MKKYINILLMAIIVVTLKNGTIREFDGEYFHFSFRRYGCSTVTIWEKEQKIFDSRYNKKIIEFNCNAVISVEKK